MPTILIRYHLLDARQGARCQGLFGKSGVKKNIRYNLFMESLKLLENLEEKLTQHPNDLPTAKLIANFYKKLNPHTNQQTPYMGSMYSDEGRTQFYKKIIDSNVKDKSVLEIGTGLGLLSLFIADNDPKDFITCELNKRCFDTAKMLFEKNNYTEKIEIINKSSFELYYKENIPHKFDYIVHELFGQDPFAEGLLPIALNAKRLLKDGGLFLPGKVSVWALPVEIEDLNFSTFKKNFENINSEDINDFYVNSTIKLDKNIDIIKSYKPIEIFNINLNEDFSLKGHFEIEREMLNDANALVIYFMTEQNDITLSSYKDDRAHFIADHWGTPVFKLDNTNENIQFSYDRNRFRVQTKKGK